MIFLRFPLGCSNYFPEIISLSSLSYRQKSYGNRMKCAESSVCNTDDNVLLQATYHGDR